MIILCVDGQRVLTPRELRQAVSKFKRAARPKLLVNLGGRVHEVERYVNPKSSTIIEYRATACALELMRLVRRTGWCDPSALHRLPGRAATAIESWVIDHSEEAAEAKWLRDFLNLHVALTDPSGKKVTQRKPEMSPLPEVEQLTQFYLKIAAERAAGRDPFLLLDSLDTEGVIRFLERFPHRDLRPPVYEARISDASLRERFAQVTDPGRPRWRRNMLKSAFRKIGELSSSGRSAEWNASVAARVHLLAGSNFRARVKEYDPAMILPYLRKRGDDDLALFFELVGLPNDAGTKQAIAIAERSPLHPLMTLRLAEIAAQQDGAVWAPGFLDYARKKIAPKLPAEIQRCANMFSPLDPFTFHGYKAGNFLGRESWTTPLVFRDGTWYHTGHLTALYPEFAATLWLQRRVIKKASPENVLELLQKSTNQRGAPPLGFSPPTGGPISFAPALTEEILVHGDLSLVRSQLALDALTKLGANRAAHRHKESREAVLKFIEQDGWWSSYDEFYWLHRYPDEAEFRTDWNNFVKAVTEGAKNNQLSPPKSAIKLTRALLRNVVSPETLERVTGAAK